MSTSATDNERAGDSNAAINGLLNPSSIVIIGASSGNLLSGVVMRSLRKYKFPGNVVGVNPKHQDIEGFRCYPTIEDVPDDEHFDLAYLSIRRDIVAEQLRACGERGIRAAVVISSGFAEVTDGANFEAELKAVANEYGMAICGPNCAGVANFLTDFMGVGTNNFLSLSEIKTGGAAIVTASGGLGNTIFSYLQANRIGCSHLISIGNETVTTAADYLDALLDDPEVTMIIGYIEQVRNPVQFEAAVIRAHDMGKPVIILKPGKTEVGRDAMRTHTAALSGSREAYEGWCRRLGIILVDDIDELAETAVALQRVGTNVGDGIGLFSLPGGGLALVTDHATDNGFFLPPLSPSVIDSLAEIMPPMAAVKNPLDPTAGYRDSPLLAEAMVRMSQESDIDTVVYFPLVSDATVAEHQADQLIELKARLKKPLVSIWTVGSTPELESGPWKRLRDAEVALYTRTSNCFKALRRLREYAEYLESWPTRRTQLLQKEELPANVVPSATSLIDHLQSAGLRVPRTVLATSADQAAAMVDEWGVPVVLKVNSPDILHKTELGGVRLEIENAEQASKAFEEILLSVTSLRPDAVINGIDVQEFAPHGIEILLGVTTEPDLGPTLTIGAGGVLAELLDDAVTVPVPLHANEVREFLQGLKCWKLLSGYRGAGPSDVEALCRVASALSVAAHSWREHAPEIDLNPILVAERGHGAWLVDLLASFGAGGDA